MHNNSIFDLSKIKKEFNVCTLSEVWRSYSTFTLRLQAEPEWAARIFFNTWGNGEQTDTHLSWSCDQVCSLGDDNLDIGSPSWIVIFILKQHLYFRGKQFSWALSQSRVVMVNKPKKNIGSWSTFSLLFILSQAGAQQLHDSALTACAALALIWLDWKSDIWQWYLKL